MELWTLYFDGSCGPTNPGGTAAYGYALYHNNELIDNGHGIIGSGANMSNNLAEHFAAAEGMKAFLTHYQNIPNTTLQIYGDSKLVINQLNKVWGGRRDRLYFSEFVRSSTILGEIRKKHVRIHIAWIPREQNTICDELSKAHLNQ